MKPVDRAEWICNSYTRVSGTFTNCTGDLHAFSGAVPPGPFEPNFLITAVYKARALRKESSADVLS